MCTPEDLREMTKARIEGRHYEVHGVNEVKGVPDNFKEWCAANSDRIEAARERGTLPYFLKVNRI